MFAKNDSAVTGLRCRGPGLHGPCGGFGIDDVGLAATAACLTVEAVDLDDTVAVLAQPPGQAGPVAAGAFQAHLLAVPRPVAHASKDA
ncbi:hypothetical protein ACFWIJ_34685 [Streptomyces sp. NPDC127079]|uniref:hypothetical protein n=1 Tax=Streptomyces sp. NPDC127079 TaxID=3347132 RepID=UPI003649DD5F